MQTKPISKPFNYSLEGLRGLCALTVALCHVQAAQILLDDVNIVIAQLQFGHQAVMIFFILSGYVIGINYPRTPIRTYDYLVKRFIRIYPIYFIVILLCFLLESKLTASHIWGQLLILQGWMKTVSSNGVLWSIHYEIIFYLLFLISFKTTSKIVFEIIFLAILSLAIWQIPTIPQIIGGYAAGFAFWLTGLFISRIQLEHIVPDKTKVPLLSLFLLIFVYQHLSGGVLILNGIGLPNPERAMVSAADLFALPVCFLMIVEIGSLRINQKLLNYAYLIAYGLPLVLIIYLLTTKKTVTNIHWIISVISYLGAVSLLFIKQRKNQLHKLAFWGGISYAIYIIHYPIGVFMGMYVKPDSIAGKIVLTLAWFACTVGLSWFLEKKYQPYVRKILNDVLLKSNNKLVPPVHETFDEKRTSERTLS